MAQLDRLRLCGKARRIIAAALGSARAAGSRTRVILTHPERDGRRATFEVTADRRNDRLLAYLGLLDDAAPLFSSGANVPRAGVLLALPALVAGGVFECAQATYGSLGPAFYGLRTSLLTLLLMALWRIKRPEALESGDDSD